MSATGLTLYQIETELLELLQLRDDVADEVRLTSANENAREFELAAIDKEIAEYVSREVAKVDNIAGLLRECAARAKTLKAEEERIRGLRKRWEDREQRVKDRAAQVMAMQVPPEEIAAANQGKVLRRLTGKSSELKLCKSPPSVEVTDMSLVPAEMQAVAVTMPLKEWAQVLAIMRKAFGNDCYMGEWWAITEPAPDKRAIGAVLKSTVPCEKCRGRGSVDDTDEIESEVTCTACGGSGSVRGAVAGTRLIEDSVHLRLG